MIIIVIKQPGNGFTACMFRTPWFHTGFLWGGGGNSEIAFPEKKETFEIALQTYFERKLVLTGL